MNRQVPMQHRGAMFVPATVNEESRTAELVWTTGASVTRMDWMSGERYSEALDMSPEAVDMTRLNGGAPLLNSHRASTLADQIGVVERAWLDGNEGRATVRFSSRPDADAIFRDVKDGILRNVSVGYSVDEYKVTKRDGQPDEWRAVRWQPMEISLVPVGADAAAGVRDAGQMFPCVFRAEESATNPQEQMMPEINTPVEPSPDAVAVERARVADILIAARAAKLPQGEVDKYIADGIAADEVRKLIITKLAVADEATPTRSAAGIVTVQDETQTRRDAVTSALLHRHDSKNELPDHARVYMGESLLDLARAAVERLGVNTRGMNKLEIAQRAFHTTSDFPYILAAVANKTLRAAYQAAPQTFRPFTRQVNATDFKTMYRTQLGDAPSLAQVNEHGEFTYGTVGENRESYALNTYGKIFAISRQAIINDDLGAFTRMPEMFGRAAADLESDVVWAIITANATMNDGYALFQTANHGNLSSTSDAISVTSLGAARAAMTKQTGLGGRYITVRPEFLIVPPEKELLAQQYTSTQFVSAQSSNINPFGGALQVISEPRLSANSTTAWYLAASPGQIDTIEYAYLSGQSGPYMEERMGFEVDGMELKVRLDFAAKAIDHRGLFKNPGA